MKISKRLLLFCILIITYFFVACVALNYVAIFVFLNKNGSSGFFEEINYSFKASYLYTLPEQFTFAQTAFLSAIFSLLTYLKIDSVVRIRNTNKNVNGSARWATQSEIRKSLSRISENRINNAKHTGIILAKCGGSLYIDTETINSLIIGTTRSGKGQTFVLPMLRLIASGKEKQSLIINDPKGELLENCYKILMDNNYKILVLNLRDTDHSNMWNPMHLIIEEYKSTMDEGRDLTKVSKLVNSLSEVFTTDITANQKIWAESAKSLLSAMILYLLDIGYQNDCIDKLNMYSVYNFFLENTTKIITRTEKVEGQTYITKSTALDLIFDGLPLGHPAKLAYTTSRMASGEMKSSINAVLSNNLSIFGSDVGISKLTAQNDINIDDLISHEKPCAIFMVLPDEDKSRNVLSSLFITQCYSRLITLAEAFPQQKLPRRVQFVLDEFGNLTTIPDMDTKITISLGRNILFNLFVQDLNQLDSKYKGTAKTIRSNCGNVIYINSLDPDTNECISRMLGSETAEYRTYSGNLNEFLKNQTVNVKSKRLLTSDELARLKFGEVIIQRQRCYPIHSKFKPFYKLGLPVTALSDICKDLKLNSNISLEDKLFPLEYAQLPEPEPEYLFTEEPVKHYQEQVAVNEEKPDIKAAALQKLDQQTKNKFGAALTLGDTPKCTKMLNSARMMNCINADEFAAVQELIKSIAEMNTNKE